LSDGREVLLHRLIVDPEGNDEVVIINDDPSDLRLINLWKVGRGKTAHLKEGEKEQRARWIKPINENLQKMVKENYKQAVAKRSLSSVKLEVTLTLTHVAETVSVQIGEEEYGIKGFDAKDRIKLFNVISILMTIIKNSYDKVE